jgi:hypothetical protein
MIAFRLVLVIVLAGWATPARAHNLLLDARVTGERLRVEAFYDDDTPAQQATITVENESGAVVATGKTDERGTWSCPRLAPGAYVLRARSVDHAAKKALVVSDQSRDSAPERAAASASAPRSPGASDGPTRAELTSTPWLKVALGCGLISIIFGVFWLSRHNSARTKSSDFNAS